MVYAHYIDIHVVTFSYVELYPYRTCLLTPRVLAKLSQLILFVINKPWHLFILNHKTLLSNPNKLLFADYVWCCSSQYVFHRASKIIALLLLLLLFGIVLLW